MSACVCVCVCILQRLCTRVCVHIATTVCACVCVYLLKHPCVRVCVHIETTVCVRACGWACVAGIWTVLNTLIRKQLTALMVYPISVLVPVLSDEVASRCLQPPGAGILRVTLLSASHLKNTDTFSKSDPACFLTLHDDTAPVTKLSSMISNNLNPVWNESFEYIVNKASTKFAFQVMCVGV